MSKPEDRDYPVGKGRPPLHSRFRKGQSGNPSGRPKGANSAKSFAACLWEALDAKVPIVEQGRTRRISTRAYIFKKLVNDAAQGKPAAVKQVLSLMQLHPQPVHPAPNADLRNADRITEGMGAEASSEIWLEVLRSHQIPETE